jgi:hypothetical protein
LNRHALTTHLSSQTSRLDFITSWFHGGASETQYWGSKAAQGLPPMAGRITAMPGEEDKRHRLTVPRLLSRKLLLNTLAPHAASSVQECMVEGLGDLVQLCRIP